MAIKITKLSPNVGAQIEGVDLSQEQNPETIKRINDAWLEHGVVVFRDQDLGDHEQVRVAQYFGELKKRPFPKSARAESLARDRPQSRPRRRR